VGEWEATRAPLFAAGKVFLVVARAEAKKNGGKVTATFPR